MKGNYWEKFTKLSYNKIVCETTCIIQIWKA